MKQSNKILSGIALLLAAVAIPATASAAKPTIKIAIDSAYIVQGQQIPLHITVSDPTGTTDGKVIFAFDSIPPQLEVVEYTRIDGTRNLAPSALPALEVVSAQNGEQLLEATYKLQSFDSGVYRMPPVGYVYGNDTVYSNGVSLKVMPVDLGDKEDINPDAGPVVFKSKWYDVIPDFLTDYWYWYLIGLLIIGAGIVAYLILAKKVTIKIMPQKKPRPAYEVAMEKLVHLKSEQLWEKGQEKEFYTELTDILREYLDRRFDIKAMEMTSSQIRAAIRNREETAMSKDLMNQILEVADFVKFANMKPLREDNIKSFEAARQFVEDTKPVETEEPAPETK